MYNNQFNNRFEQAKGNLGVTYNQDKYVKRARQQREQQNTFMVYDVVGFVVLCLIYVFIFPKSPGHEQVATEKCLAACPTTKFSCEKTCSPFVNLKDKHPACINGCKTRYQSACERGCTDHNIDRCVNADECKGGLCKIFLIVVKSACSAAGKRYADILGRLTEEAKHHW